MMKCAETQSAGETSENGGLITVFLPSIWLSFHCFLTWLQVAAFSLLV